MLFFCLFLMNSINKKKKKKKLFQNMIELLSMIKSIYLLSSKNNINNYIELFI